MRRLIPIILIASIIGFVIISKSQPTPEKNPFQAQTNAPSVNLNEKVSVTLNPISDYLSNPGIGWQEAHGTPILAETVHYERPAYSWKNQNPSEGQYNFGPVDADLAEAVGQGKQFSFRIYSANNSPQMPDWVEAKGATKKGNNPDYSNCVYQEHWGNFVNAIRGKYDGNPNIAFIDISGYGNYNEWSWTDGQTEFDSNFSNPASIDGQARKRLADAFIGGSGTITCRKSDGSTQSVNYSYPGFSKTQLVMPYAGIQQSTRYVESKRRDVGFRHDCLGRAGAFEEVTGKVGDVINRIWANAPVIYEFCGSNATNADLLSRADQMLRATHGSITHDNFSGNRDVAGLKNILRTVGYRYQIKSASWLTNVLAGTSVDVTAIWANGGYAPNYPKMGQSFTLHYYLIDPSGNVAVDAPSNENTARWVPGEHSVTAPLSLPGNLAVGTYQLKTAVIDRRTGRSINLATEGRDTNGRYPLGNIEVVAAQPSPTASPISEASPQPSPTAMAGNATPTSTPNNMPTGGVVLTSSAGFTSGCTILTALPTSGNAPLNVNFIAQAFDTKGAIQMYEFDFGDSSGGQLKIVRQKSSMATHRYNNSGSFMATVRAQDSQGKWLTSLDCQKLINVGGGTLGVATAAPTTTTLPKTGVSDVIPLGITISAIGGYLLLKRSARNIDL